MKIEMGESLFYSWLRHVKECQIVQTNWKVSPQWNLQNEEDIKVLKRKVDDHFSTKYKYDIFKKNASLSQILQQGECDVIGISIQNGESNLYAVDVAFHENGLQYGSREVTVMKVIAKTVRTAMCLWGYMDCKNAEIIFASPKINPAIMNDIEPCIEDLNNIFDELGYEFKARIIANEDFNEDILQPILIVSDGVADTSELFVRSYQMYKMFAGENSGINTSKRTCAGRTKVSHVAGYEDTSKYKELKIGKIANVVLRRILEQGNISSEELEKMQTKEYSKLTFGIQFPLIVKDRTENNAVRYYAEPLYIHGEEYYLCSQWVETKANNDRLYLIKWIEEHE